jgi:hypothetical protein
VGIQTLWAMTRTASFVTWTARGMLSASIAIRIGTLTVEKKVIAPSKYGVAPGWSGFAGFMRRCPREVKWSCFRAYEDNLQNRRTHGIKRRWPENPGSQTRARDANALKATARATHAVPCLGTCARWPGDALRLAYRQSNLTTQCQELPPRPQNQAGAVALISSPLVVGLDGRQLKQGHRTVVDILDSAD